MSPGPYPHPWDRFRLLIQDINEQLDRYGYVNLHKIANKYGYTTQHFYINIWLPAAIRHVCARRGPKWWIWYKDYTCKNTQFYY